MHRCTGPLRHKLSAGSYKHLSPARTNARVKARKCVRTQVRTYFRKDFQDIRWNIVYIYMYISCTISQVSIICDMIFTGENIRMDVNKYVTLSLPGQMPESIVYFVDYTIRLCQTTCWSIYQTTKCQSICQTTCQCHLQEIVGYAKICVRLHVTLDIRYVRKTFGIYVRMYGMSEDIS